ncbi:MAG: pentapeptide repeat-containing protein [Paludibacteraceae bacterium]|nr:pentapeptide repeat-containing protein [Paludibacteraceae bacterium]
MNRIYILITVCLLFLSCGSAQSDNQKEIKASDIIKLLGKGKDIQLHEMIVVGDLDFTTVHDGFMSSLTTIQTPVTQNIFFIDCVFMGNVTTCGSYLKLSKNVWFEKNVSFVSCDFRKDLNFSNSTIMGQVSFAKSIFRGNAKLENMTVHGKANSFCEIEAEKDFSMAQSDFRGDVNFMDAKFGGSVLFQYFRGFSFQFNNVSCADRLDLSNMTISENAYLNYLKCTKDATLSFTKIYGNADFLQGNYRGVADYTGLSVLGKARFNDSQYRDSVAFVDTMFIKPSEQNRVKTKEQFQAEAEALKKAAESLSGSEKEDRKESGDEPVKTNAEGVQESDNNNQNIENKSNN